jgi:hypothetical protein
LAPIKARARSNVSAANRPISSAGSEASDFREKDCHSPPREICFFQELLAAQYCAGAKPTERCRASSGKE